MKKNCNNCKHLEWGFGDINDPEGFMCNKRDYSIGSGDSHQKESDHLNQLDKNEYREKTKKCCELKEVQNET